MIPPEMPTCLAVGKPVFDDDTHGKIDDGVGVMSVGSGDVGSIDVEEYFTFRTTMNGVRKFQNDGSPFRAVAEMPKFSFSLSMLSAVVTAVRTRTFDEYFRAFFDDGLGQIVEIFDSFRGIGQIVTGTGHGKILLET